MNNLPTFEDYILEKEDLDFFSFIIESEGYIFEDAQPKDVMRINGIIGKSKGNQDKQIQLSQMMANKIKDKKKSFRRYEAALQILGATHPVTNIFGKKAQELGNRDVTVMDVSTGPKSKDDEKELFVYDAKTADTVWNKYLEFVSKLRGRNWGTPFSNKLSKNFNSNELAHLAIQRRLWEDGKFNGGLRYSGRYPKLDHASLPGRDYFIEGILKELDFGDAKTDKNNPAYILFKKQRVDDIANMDLEELRVRSQSALDAYTIPKYLYKPGSSFTQYSSQKKSNGKQIMFFDPWAMYFWNENMIGQMSDGYWENSRKYEGEWRYWSSLLPIFDPTISSKDERPGDNRDLMNPKLVQQYAVQSDGEYQTIGKIAYMNNSELLPLVRYGDSYSLKSVGSITKAEEIAKSKGVDIELFLAFLAAPTLSKGQVKKLVGNAHSNMLISMKQ